MRIIGWPAHKNSSRNPYQSLLYKSVETAGAEVIEFSPVKALIGGRADILHVHWPDAFLAAETGWRFWPRYAYLRLLFLVSRMRGTKLVWTAHNLQREEQRNADRMARFFWPWFLSQLDGLITMTHASSALTATMPVLAKTPRALIPHGHYRSILSEIGETTDKYGRGHALFFGSITAYKNVWKLLEAFLEMPKGAAQLSICGKMSLREPDTRLESALDELSEDQRDDVIYENKFLTNNELEERLSAADLVIFPYSDVLNSGAAIFALSAGRPILASDNSLFRELQTLVGADWVILIDGELDPAQLASTLDHARTLRSTRALPDLSALDWNRIGVATVAFYNRCMAGERV